MKPVVLIIRDGWGINPQSTPDNPAPGDATALAKTPFHDQLYQSYPLSHVSASGEDVGLPAGQMGNSEVGHLNLGAGRIVYQDLLRINRAIEDGSLDRNSELIESLQSLAQSGGRLHLLGLVSDGGVHSHQDHLLALAKIAHEQGIKEILLHAITDGRDTSPTGAKKYLQTCQEVLEPLGVSIATVIGRYYAMDRDQRWERNKIAWDAIVLGRGDQPSGSPSQAVAEAYEKGQTDEFHLPMIFAHADEQRIRDGDAILFFNFRADRARQLSRAFLDKDFEGFEREATPRIAYTTLTEYEPHYDARVLFKPINLENTLGQVVSAADKKQLRIAETEKYPHVTYFFNGGVEEPNPGEERVIIPSPKVATYDLQPEMSAPEVTQAVVDRLDQFDLVILNFANPDMVGHTGVVEAAVKAVETIDASVERVVQKTLELGGALIITADHGNCEYMINPDGTPHTAHTTNLVHCLYVAADSGDYQIRNGILADIAPTLLQLLGIEKPEEMTGRSLLEKK